MKLDAIPTNVVDKEGNSVAFNGWVNLFAHEPKSQHPNPTGGVQPDPVPDFTDSDIPF